MTLLLHYHLHEVKPYINWAYFFHAWRTTETQSPELWSDAQEVLDEMEGKVRTHAIVRLLEANADGEDIVLSDGRLIPFLRQQHGETCLCWADFVRPVGSGQTDTIGLFATSVDEEMVSGKFADNKSVNGESAKNQSPDEYRQLLCQTLADRLAEATAERMHEEVRKNLWGYASDEQLSIEEMFQEKYIGRRPAVGYPSLPDQSLNFLIDEFLGFSSIGINLTESGAMRPHASTSGLLFAHPLARHFAIGKIDDTQLRDYARRRGLPEDVMRRFLASNL